MHECQHEVDLALLCKDMKEIKADVKSLVDAVTGKSGLSTDVELLKAWHTDHEEQHKSSKNNNLALWLVVMGAIVTEVIGKII